MILSNSDGLAGCDLLRGLVFWEKPNSEIEAGLAAVSGTPMDFQGLARELTGLMVPEEVARVIFSALAVHVQKLREVLRRPVGVRTAALDLLDHLESRLREEGVVQIPPHENLVRMAFVDYLTGLPNFRSLSERFENEIKRAARYGRLLSLIMFDLDGFKEINDRFGHMAGNAALKHVAVLLRNFVRETDVAGRFGGDEFMVLSARDPEAHGRTTGRGNSGGDCRYPTALGGAAAAPPDGQPGHGFVSTRCPDGRIADGRSGWRHVQGQAGRAQPGVLLQAPNLRAALARSVRGPGL